ncbi:MAG: eCIS core domain-containing protein [Planctomycetota bacterium]
MPVHTSGHRNLQPKLQVNAPGDIYEQEADRVANQVLRQNIPKIADHKVEIQAKPSPQVTTGRRDINEDLKGRLKSNKGGGNSLSDEVRAYFEPRMTHDFSKVRVHTDNEAARMNQELGAQAFTHERDIFFGAGRYNPHSIEGKRVLAHELVHVIQQAADHRKHTAVAGEHHRPAAHVPSIQRVVEVRPPGRGEASAFDRRQELIDRLNAQSAAIQYRLDGRQLRYDVADEAALTHFDSQMRGFIDREEVVPMRLITSAGRVQNAAGTWVTLIADSFINAYVDLDDMLAADDLSFQSILIHFLTERFNVPNYERRIGTNIGNLFPRSHRAGHDAQAEHFQQIFNDPSIYFNYEEPKANGDYHIAFRSRNERYRVFVILRRTGRAVVDAEVLVRTTDRRWMTVEDFLAARAAAENAEAPAPAAQAPAPAAP